MQENSREPCISQVELTQLRIINTTCSTEKADVVLHEIRVVCPYRKNDNIAKEICVL